MRPEVVGELVNGVIPFVGGLFVTLLGFRVVGKKPGESVYYDEWHAKYGRPLRLLGPLLMVWGLVSAVIGVMRAT